MGAKAKKIFGLYIALVLFFNFSYSENIESVIEGNIIEDNFGMIVKVGLVSFGYQQKLFIKTTSGIGNLSSGEYARVLFPEEVVVITVEKEGISDGVITVPSFTFEKNDVFANVAISRDGVRYYNYRGELSLIYDKKKNGIALINSVPSEEYLYSVVAGEIDANFGEEAIKAQAIAARTYLYKNVEAGKNKTSFDVVDTVQDQLYLGMNNEKEKINQLVNDTKGLVIFYGSEIISAYYFANSGGMTANIEDAWNGSKPCPYLVSVDDTGNWESFPRANWVYKISKEKISGIFGFKVEDIQLVTVKDLRVTEMIVYGEKEVTMTGADFRKKLGYAILSTAFSVENTGSEFIFGGTGSGHGVGMSQWGAGEMGKKGFSYEEILKFYYTGIEIKSVEKTEKYVIMKRNTQ